MLAVAEFLGLYPGNTTLKPQTTVCDAILTLINPKRDVGARSTIQPGFPNYRVENSPEDRKPGWIPEDWVRHPNLAAAANVTAN